MLLTLVGLRTFKMVARTHETHTRMKFGQRLKLVNFCIYYLMIQNPVLSLCFPLGL